MNTKNKFDVVVIGNIINETVVTNGVPYGPVLGSPAAYSSIAMAILGRRVGIVSYYGPDLNNGLIQNLDVVNTAGLIRTQRTSTNKLIYQQDGTKVITFEHKAPDIKKSDILPDYIEKCDFFYICPMDYEVEIDGIQMLHNKGKHVVIDLGGYGGATSTRHPRVDDSEQKALLGTLCANSRIIKASREDLSLMMSCGTVDEMSDFFMDFGAENCVITMSDDGSFYRNKGKKGKYIPVCKSNNPFNLTGAGDTFGAGLMAEYCRNKNIDRAVRYGNAVASLVVEKEGGCVMDRMPTHDLTIRRMKGEIIF